MKNNQIQVGNSTLNLKQKTVSGQYILHDDELFYEISNFDFMAPFFMTIVSDSDHWMFIFSNGALTAGRKNPDHALFPYYTDDKIQDMADITGSKTLFLLDNDKSRILWEPFSKYYDGIYNIERKCYKNVYGNKIIFSERNLDLNLTFNYAWLNSEKYGFIKKSRLSNHGEQPIKINLLDGIQNLLPADISQQFQSEYSTLADAYKKNELDRDTGLGIFALSSVPVDKAEPSEALKATTAWSAGLEKPQMLVSSQQLDKFRSGFPIEHEVNVRAVRSSYFINSQIDLSPNQEKTWYIVADIEKNAADVIALKQLLMQKANLPQMIETNVKKGTQNLITTVAKADGLQQTADLMSSSRHYSNVLFNIMRGGIFRDNYFVDQKDLARFVESVNKAQFKKHKKFLQDLPQKLEHTDLISITAEQNDTDLIRIIYDYLPLTFSRRHGDPSRPWNRFSIDIKDKQGNPLMNYEGNWRDIFQNWEALALSFPEYIESMISKFVNASTADGYNPYRVTREGFDWEVMDPRDPWSYIGYWGDHQIIYLLKLLELSVKYHPGKLQTFLTSENFVYANVPYRIKTYSEILKDPQNTVDYDSELNHEIERRVRAIGSDGKYINSNEEQLYYVNLSEKLLVPLLTKLSNFIPEAGIWMNTQRPEWNDANNALVGFGVSMVTLYYLRRYLAFCCDIFRDQEVEEIQISSEVANFCSTLHQILNDRRDLLQGSISDRDRKELIDGLGSAGSEYRDKIYSQGIGNGKTMVRKEQLIGFFELSLKYIDHTINANKREDGLYHSYNLMMVVDGKGIAIRYLYEMLEGQVAVLSSGSIEPGEALQILTALRKSILFREDQYTYILYPDRALPRFLEKNNIPRAAVNQSKLLQTLVKQGNREIVIEDINGDLHFNDSFRNADELKTSLEGLKRHEFGKLIEEESDLVLKIYEQIFDHQSFTGRSGTFFKYEGLGCTYWHMVSKLLLAVQENFYQAVEQNESPDVLDAFRKAYYDIRKGIGVTKSPDVYGGFPTDPYSHTPAHSGVQQPGMTGQVKEDIITRFGELGVRVHDGKISFYPGLLRAEEFLSKSSEFNYKDINETEQTIRLTPGCLVFTLIQVPVIYRLSDSQKIVVHFAKGKKKSITSQTLDRTLSGTIFKRTGEIAKIEILMDHLNHHPGK